MSTTTDPLRLFYALWPEEDICKRLVGLQTLVSGRKIAPENLHMTLVFLGQQSCDLLPVLQQAMDELPSAGITLNINALGYFRKPQVAWAGPSATPQSLFDLQRALWDRLLQLKVPLKPSAGFRPHITLARDASAPAISDAPLIVWPVRRMALMASVSKPGSVSYVPVTERPLG